MRLSRPGTHRPCRTACTKWARPSSLFFFFFNDTATTEFYTLSLHDALPILLERGGEIECRWRRRGRYGGFRCFSVCIALEEETWLLLDPQHTDSTRQWSARHTLSRSEEHTSELQSLTNLVCRLLLEKKKTMR